LRRPLSLPLTPLPIDPLLPDILAALRSQGRAVLQAEPGAGKTTRVPVALLHENPQLAGEIWVVEPRRMAALLAARHVAAELGEKAGETVGYRVRLDEKIGPSTRIVYATDGLLLRRMLADPQLRGIDAVILDEFHERRLVGDLLALLVRRLRQTTRPELRLLVMSATLDTATVSQWLAQKGDAGAPVLHATGRQFPVTVEHAATLDQRPLEDQVASAVRRLLAEAMDGDVLVFLPGAAEIRKCERALSSLANQHDLALRPLHGSLPIDEQERAIAPERQRKIVLATNIAETSVTLPRVVAVIDSGLARVAKHAVWSGLPSLQLARISQASATQRAGRAGRVRAGRCLRLYTQHDHDTRPAFDVPEIKRADLAEAILALKALDVEAENAQWLTPPEPQQVLQALDLLGQLGAIAADRITPRGRQMLQLPLSPRLARLVLAAAELGIAEDGCTLAAILAEGGARLEGEAGVQAAHGHSDLAVLLEQQRRRRDPQVGQIARQIRAQLPSQQKMLANRDDALGLAVLTAFGDRVAKRRQTGSVDVELAGGRAAKLDARSQVTDAEWLVAVDAEERRDGKGATTMVRLAQGIDPSWLLDLFAAQVDTQSRLLWNAQRGRVMAEERMLYRGLVLDASVTPAQPSPEAAALLQVAVQAAGLAAIADAEALDELSQRLAFAREQAGVALPDLPTLLAASVAELCETRTTLAEVKSADLFGILRNQVRASLAGQGQVKLDAAAPEQVQLPGGRKVRVHYPPGHPPWLESRLQDFFGQADGPRVGLGKVPVVLHLLAPNMRPVQLTSDLAGFWTRHYPAVKKELQRRYPRHAWPEDPRSAVPPVRK
jgi:ATP-dependent helicase HrpB